ncbi:MAG TPA: hypothetical protein VM260_25185, partial [Pirellula sp.]|nr:hypothetical protein [Pirellula sp.]
QATAAEPSKNQMGASRWLTQPTHLLCTGVQQMRRTHFFPLRILAKGIGTMIKMTCIAFP